MSVPDTTVVHGAGIDHLPPIEFQTPGSLIAALRAILVDGWHDTPVLSMTFDGETGLVTATFSEQHPFTYPQVINVTGANETEYNGRWRIAEPPGTHEVKFVISNVPSGDATGTLFMQCAPAGWTMPEINLDETIAIFKPQPLRGGDYSIRVANDMGGGGAWLYSSSGSDASLVEVLPSFTDLDTYASVSHTDSRITHGSDTTFKAGTALQIGDPVVWSFAANSHMLYLFIQNYDNTVDTGLVTYGHAFGYAASRRTTPDFLWCTTAYDSDTTNYDQECASRWGEALAAGDSHKRLSHSAAQTTDPESWFLLNASYLGRYGSGTIDGGELLYTYPLRMAVGNDGFEGSRHVGLLPGVGTLLHRPTTIPRHSIIDTETTTFLFERHYAYERSSSAAFYDSTDYMGGCLLDVMGPWPTEV